MIDERRSHPRHAVLAQIRVVQNDVNHIMEVGDISLSGMFIRTPKIRQLGFKVGLELELALFSIEDLDNVELQGSIVRISMGDREEPGFAIQFLRLNEATRRGLGKIVQSALITTVDPPPLPKKPPK